MLLKRRTRSWPYVAILISLVIATVVGGSWNLRELIHTCEEKFRFSSICDPDDILNSASDVDNHQRAVSTDVAAIAIALEELKNNHYVSNSLRGYDRYCGYERGRPVLMAIVIVDSIMIQNNNDEIMYQNLGTLLENSWLSAARRNLCERIDIMIFISLTEDKILMTRSQVLKEILTRQRMEMILDRMRPELKKKHYKKSLILAVEDITSYVDLGPPATAVLRTTFLVALGFLILLSIQIANANYPMESSNMQGHNSNIASAQKLMIKYDCTSCLICLEKFKLDPDGRHLGTDGNPVEILQCGHAYDRPCWLQWYHSEAPNSNRCPTCFVFAKSPNICNPAPIVENSNRRRRRRRRARIRRHSAPVIDRLHPHEVPPELQRAQGRGLQPIPHAAIRIEQSENGQSQPLLRHSINLPTEHTPLLSTARRDDHSLEDVTSWIYSSNDQNSNSGRQNGPSLSDTFRPPLNSVTIPRPHLNIFSESNSSLFTPEQLRRIAEYDRRETSGRPYRQNEFVRAGF